MRREDVPPLKLTAGEAARQLGVTRSVHSRALDGRAGISPEMALRIEVWLGVDNGGHAAGWLAMHAPSQLLFKPRGEQSRRSAALRFGCACRRRVNCHRRKPVHALPFENMGLMLHRYKVPFPILLTIQKTLRASLPFCSRGPMRIDHHKNPVRKTGGTPCRFSARRKCHRRRKCV